jgi:hypothetical protein
LEANMDMDNKIVMSDAAWAWEGLRRNAAYRNAWRRHQGRLPDVCDQHPTIRYLYLGRAYLEAEVYGLIAFADPDLPASETPVLWRPSLYKGALKVSLSEAHGNEDSFTLASLKCFPTVLDTACGIRHIRLVGHSFWIQLVSEDLISLDESTRVSLMFDGQAGMSRRLKTAEQLLSLHKSGNGAPNTIKRRPNRDKLLEGLLAFDIYSGADGPQGSLRDIAIALFGEDRITDEWASNRSLKDRAIRARNRGKLFVNGGYKALLRKANF